MDLTFVGGDEPRVLAARHISADKTVPDVNIAINTTLLCHTYSLQPDFHSYVAALDPYAWAIWTYGIIVLAGVYSLYVVTIRSALRLRQWQDSATSVIVVLAVYPIVASAAFIVVVLPRGRLIGEAIAQEAVMISLYHLFCLVIGECNGVDQLVRRAGGSRLETRVLPCCCWPCCVIPRPEIQKKTFGWLRLLVLQVPVTQTFLYILMLLLWTEDIKVFLDCFVYIQPFVATSILFGVWGVIMCVRAAEAVGARPRRRFVVFQLVLIIVKLQCGFAKVLPEFFDLPCVVPLNPSVFVNMIQNIIMMFEMLVLSAWAWRLYTKDTFVKVQQVVVAVIDDNSSERSESRSDKNDGLNNNSVESNREIN